MPPVAASAAAVAAAAACAVAVSAPDGSIWISADIRPLRLGPPPPRCAILPVHFSGEMKISEPGGAVLALRDDEGTIIPPPSSRPRDLVVLAELGAPRGGDHDVDREETAVIQLQPVEVCEPRRHVGGEGQQPVAPGELHRVVVQQACEGSRCQLGDQSDLSARLIGDDGKEGEQT
eukprot:scaffold120797_cov57-Phaeocystis_antarctica.AAC.1